MTPETPHISQSKRGRSIRWTLQLWHASILAVAVAGVATVAYLAVSQARLKEADVELESAAQLMAGKLRALPESPPPPRGFYDDGPPPRPSGRQFEQLVSVAKSVNLPPGFLERHEADETYFVVWSDTADDPESASSTEVFKTVGPAPDVNSIALPRPDRRNDWPADDAPSNRPRTATSPPPPIFNWREDRREVVLFAPAGMRVLVGRSLKKEYDELAALVRNLVGAGAGVMLLGLVGGWILSRRVIAPIAAMNETARTISEEKLSTRIEENPLPGELRPLAALLNGAFARLEAAFARQRQFTADASHELRTPLAVIRSKAELALSRERTPDEYRAALQTCVNAADRMTRLVESLLALARADAVKLVLSRLPVDLADAASEAVALTEPLANERNVSVTLRIATAPTIADADRLTQVMVNLLANAIRYNKPGGSVAVETTCDATHAKLIVQDTGVGIAEEDQPHVFERFFRADKARTRADGGYGLGLSICKALVEAMGGKIRFTTEFGVGTTFVVEMPRMSHLADESQTAGSQLPTESV